MAYSKFGSTWWGKTWLNALKDIDHSNRLPRGRSYARKGAVKSVRINQNIIKAKVKGRLSTPYRIVVEIPTFTTKEENKIKKVILSNPYFVSRMLAGELPPILYDKLMEKEIQLFPDSWQSIDTNCSCPDWANPCKHIAAVIYLIANRIDKDPFLVFKLKGLDIEQALQNTEAAKVNQRVQEKSSRIRSWDDIFPGKGPNLDFDVEEGPDFSYLYNVDLSEIPDLRQDILNILPDQPVFDTERNFKRFLKKFYSRSKSQVKKFYCNNPKEPNIDLNKLVIAKIYSDRDNKMVFSGYYQRKRVVIPLAKFLEYVKYIDFEELDNLKNSMVAVWFAITFSLQLIKKGAFIAQVIQNTDEIYNLRWKPALFNAEVDKIFNTIAYFLPDGLVTLKINEEEIAVKKTEMLVTIFHFVVDYFAEIYYEFALKSRLKGKALYKFFFKTYVYNTIYFSEEEVPEAIDRWFHRFAIRNSTLVPVIKIEETGTVDRFYFNLLFLDKQDEDLHYYSFSELVEKYGYNDKFFILLKNLGVLSEYLSVVNEFLAFKGEEKIELDADEFVDFWFNSLPLLKILGVKSIIPKVLDKKLAPELNLDMKAKRKKQNINSYLNLKRLLEFEWTVAIGDREYSREEFYKLVDNYTGLVKLKDSYVFLDPKEIEKIKRKLDQDLPEMSATDMLRLGTSGKFDEVNVSKDDKSQQIFQNLLEVEKVEVPKNLNAQLREYQTRGFYWLHHNLQIGMGAILADDMGLGKTIQVITLLLKLKAEDKIKQPALIIVPTTLISNWAHEIDKFAPTLDYSIYHGADREIEKKSDTIITSYGIVRNDIDQLSKIDWTVVIIDEAQNIKNTSTQQTKAVKSLQAKMKIAMTGTPVENSIMEYWSIMDFVNKDLLGGKTQFKRKFAIPIERERNRRRIRDFQKITAPFILRRLKTDKSIIKDLPEKIETDQYCSLTDKQAAIYQNIIDSIMNDMKEDGSIQRKGLIFKLITGLKQVCNHPANYLKNGKANIKDSGKTLMLQQLLEDIFAAQEKCLIFTQYTQMGNLLLKMINKEFNASPLFLHGGVPQKKRQGMIDGFQNNRENKVFLLSLKAGGTGLNLTAASHVIHYDLWWNPAVEKQATDRAYRIGQNKNVNVHRFITEGTFEEKINKMLIDKKELADLTVKSGEKWITELSNQELEEIVTLSKGV
ncbi:MAG: DEAD/DEAH box helicase [Candidatus Marinimicrobia bacterium]|nr:DEAD/DEAH box helicase [Candidatus Neomarinimicrobiota bacterium]